MLSSPCRIPEIRRFIQRTFPDLNARFFSGAHCEGFSS